MHENYHTSQKFSTKINEKNYAEYVYPHMLEISLLGEICQELAVCIDRDVLGFFFTQLP